jgi:site-specific DNA-cytosine methylase
MHMAFDKDADACDSYERNHGHRPIQIDVNDLAEMVRHGWRPTLDGHTPAQFGDRLDLIVADPPCTPWSRAGKRLGTADERDCLHVTAEIIRLLRPRAYLIGNVPGLEDSTSWHVVQEVLAPLAAVGYCVRDFASLNAVSFGVPQFRSRPFWFGHLDGPCVKWPAPTHAPATGQASFDGHALLPYVTCRQALEHLPLAELGRPVNMRMRARGEDGRKNGGDDTRCSTGDEAARTVTARQHHKGGQILIAGVPAPEPMAYVPNGGDESVCSRPDEPARVVTSHEGIKGGQVLIATAPHRAPATNTFNDRHPPATLDAPAPAVTGSRANRGAQGGRALAVPAARSWDNHPESKLDEPGRTIKTNGGRNSRGGTSLLVDDVPQLERTVGPTRGARCQTFATGADPAPAVLSNEMGNGTTLEWPWDRPSTTIQGDERMGTPGHHDPAVGNSQHKGPNAVILSERAAAILQGFPDGDCVGHQVDAETPGLMRDGVRPGEKCRFCGEVRRWYFSGVTKSARWKQIGMAMPIAMGEAVGRAIAEQRKASGQ